MNSSRFLSIAPFFLMAVQSLWGQVSVSFSSIPSAMVTGNQYTVSAEAYGSGMIILSIYKGGVVIGDGAAAGAVAVSGTTSDSVAGNVEYVAEAHHVDSGQKFYAYATVVVSSPQPPVPSVSVVGSLGNYGSGVTVTRNPGENFFVEVRFGAIDANGDLTGIRPEVLRPDGQLDNNGGAFIAQSGNSGLVIRNVNLNQNGTWRFWTDAQDAVITPGYVTSGAWENGFSLIVTEGSGGPGGGGPGVEPSVAFTSIPASVMAGTPYSVTAAAVGDGTIVLTIRKDGVIVIDGSGQNSVSLTATATDSGVPSTQYTAEAQFIQSGRILTAASTVMVDSPQPPVAGVMVEGYVSGMKVRRAAGSSVPVTVRFNAADGNGNLTGIRPQILSPDSQLDNNGGSFIAQSGGFGSVVRTVNLNQNGIWRFWTDAQDSVIAPAHVTSGAWENGFSLVVTEEDDGSGGSGSGEYTWGSIPAGSNPGVPVSDPGVGVLAGNLSVDNKGAANYTLPLKIPPGRGGLQPALSLNYSSNGGNGPLGLGWSLATGFPQSITRGRSILARDGVVRGVTFSATDKLYLDGKRLIYMGGGAGEGTPGSVYRTEVDSFVTVTTAGTGSNIETFTVTDKNGTKMIFGKHDSPDAYHMGAGPAETLAYAYALKRVEDAVGNTVDFTYADVANSAGFRLGEQVLSEIRYTGRAGQPGAEKGVVSFHYNFASVGGDTERLDRNYAYIAGRAFAQSRRLDGINVTYNGERVAYYALGYEYAPNSGPLRLVSVAPYLRNGAGSGFTGIPETTFDWSDTTPVFATTGATSGQAALSGYLDPDMPEHFAFGDVNGDGKDDYVTFGGGIGVQLSNGNDFGAGGNWGGAYFNNINSPVNMWKLADANGDGKKDVVCGYVNPSTGQCRLWLMVSTGSSFVPPGGGNVPTEIYSAVGDFTGLDAYGNPGTEASFFEYRTQLAGGLTSRVAVADFTGDGRDDVLIHRLDGKLRLLTNQGGSFTPSLHDVGGAAVYGDTLWDGWIPLIEFRGYRVTGPTVSMIPCDINGDGISDYAWTESRSHSTSGLQLAFDGSLSFRVATGLPGGGFSSSVPLAADSWDFLPPLDNSGGWIYRENCFAVLPGDVNGDGLTDFTVLVKDAAEDASTTYPAISGRLQFLLDRWVYLSKGTAGTPQFELRRPLSGWRVNVGGELRFPWFDKVPYERFESELTAPSLLTASPDRQRAVEYTGLSNGDGMALCDVNLDGREDFVWYVPSGSSPGWWVMYSRGGGYAQPAPAPLGWLPAEQINPSGPIDPYWIMRSSRMALDLNGDGVKDYAYANHYAREAPNFVGFHRSAAPRGDRLAVVKDGLGRRTDIAYKPITDDSVYTSGAVDDLTTPAVEGVTYPIRELRNATYVVSDVWHDSGAGTPDAPTDRAQFSYQYSGNRLDLSGRGSLGFHAFVTLDRQTNLFKYQFLAQSFPMTGLTHREETYRHTTANTFNIISSHDNTVVFDTVATGGGVTLWPFISRAIEYRWEDDGENNMKSFTVDSVGSSARPEGLFGIDDRSGAHVVVVATSVFDEQTGPQLSIPGGYYASDYNPANGPSTRNIVQGEATESDFDALLGAFTSDSYNKITYGNLKKLRTEFGGGYTETVETEYEAGVAIAGTGFQTLTGRPKTVTTTVTAPSPYTSDSAPVKSYTYWGNTPLVATETLDAEGTNLDLTTIYNRGTRGRVDSVQVSSPDPAIGSYSISEMLYDDAFDLPKNVKNNYGHETATVYHPFLGQPTSVTDVTNNQLKATTVYDAMGRVLSITDAFGLVTSQSYAWTTAGASDWTKTQTVSDPSGFNGVADSWSNGTYPVSAVPLSSAYAIRTTATAKPAVTTYYDRLGRAIHTVKEGFGTQKTVADTAYNNLGQVTATSVPYLDGTAAGSVLWNRTGYDALGRVSAVTAANGTVTTTTYAGRTTTVKVDAADRDPQFTVTEVDAKGRTVKVWNPDPATGNASGTVSVQFLLDGFGRMMMTLLEGASPTAPADAPKRITATYDAHGRQLTLNDPDKGNWSYINNALGQVVSQTDAKGNVTTSTFDKLGRPLSRTTTSLGAAGDGSTETANFYYYDTSTITTAARHTVVKGAQGWIGAPEREEVVTTGAGGYQPPLNPVTQLPDPVTNLHYYDAMGRPSLELAQTDGKWFYTATTYDASNRPQQVRHYWKPAGFELPTEKPYLWQDFGYVYNYDAKSYLLSITDSLGRLWWEAEGTTGYDHLDRPVKVRKGNGHWTKRTYRDSDGVLTGLQTGASIGATDIQDMSFGFDGLGNLTSRSDTGVSETFTYDNLNRLKTTSVSGGAETTAINYSANGNIETKTGIFNGVATTSAPYSYHSNRPHAVDVAFGYTHGYDANGNLTSRTGHGQTWTLKYAGFDKPRWMAKDGVGSEFHYNANRSRVMQLEFDQMSGNAPSRYVRKRIYALGSTLELNYNAAVPGPTPTWNLDTVRIYVPGPDGIIGAREFRPAAGGTEKALVYHYDHLGSITAITDWNSTSGYSVASGNKSGRYSEDAWGQRRHPTNWKWWTASNPAATDDGGPDSLTPRGFTGHEMLDDLGLVHMNGRIYDPLLGRFLSADPLIQAPGNLQSYNRYSYVLNNPLSLTDPSGFVAIDDEIRKGISRDIQRAADIAELVHGKANGNLDIANAQHRTFQKVLNTSEFADFIVTEQSVNAQGRAVKPQRFVDDSGQVVTRYPAGSKRPDVMILNDSDHKAGILEGGAKVDLKGKIDAVADLKTGAEGIDPKWRSEVSQRVGVSETNVHEVRNGGNFQDSYERGLRRAGGFAGRALAVADVLGMATSVHHAAQQAADEQNTRNPYVGETGAGVKYSMMFDRYYFKTLPIAPMINHRIYFWNGPAAGQEIPVSRERWNELNKQLESEGRTMNLSGANMN